MKRISSSLRNLAVVFLGLAWVVSGRAELYSGNNAPGSSTNILVEVDASTTNISFILSGNATSYSHLLVKKDSPPLDTSYDFSSQVNGTTNALHLELPELSPGFYYVRVRTPLNSQTHSFSLRVDHNSPDLRSASRPVTKPLDSVATGFAGGGSRQYFRLEAPSGTPWQVRLTPNVSDTVPDVYVQWNQLPSETVFLKSSVNSTNDYLGLSPTEVTGGAYYIAVLASAGTTTRGYTMALERNVPTVLPWDNGLTHEGTQGYSNSEGRAGDYYFQITTGNPSLGAWRTALRVLTGEAALYLKRGAWPTPTTADYKSERPGSDGFILSASQFNVNEVWYVLVRATEGSQWSLVSGSPYVLDLGTVAANDASSSGPVEIGPEGLRYFRATVTADMLAWRLWLKSTNLMTNAIFVKKASLPFPVANGFELLQSGQMLMVPPYLVAGQQYFVGVLGSPGQVVDLDCRQQPILNLPFNSSFTTNVSGYGYVTFQVNVPSNQVAAWQLTLPSTNGNPNVAVRARLAPNEAYNDGFSELSGPVMDHLTLVRPVLKDGLNFITVYSPTNFSYQFTLGNAPVPVTDINYTASAVNLDTNRLGWVYFRVSNITNQLGTLGWDLLLTNFAPGTQIAIRRNDPPGIWSYRTPSLLQAAYYDQLSAVEYLQQPGHQADIWYIGVYNPSNSLGKFSLTSQSLQSGPLANGAPVARTNAAGGRWEFFSIEVPNDPNILGWDLRLTNVTAGLPQLVVARGMLPNDVRTTVGAGGAVWPLNTMWAPKTDWTGRGLAPDGFGNEEGRVLAMGMGRPLEPGTYYVGVLNKTNVSASYTLVSRWIGPGQAITVADLPFQGGSVTSTLAAREAAYYRVVVPAGKTSWKVRLTPLGSGEAMMIIVSNTLPNIETTLKKMQKDGKEFYLRLPDLRSATLPAGTNYIVVVSEGQSPASVKSIGSGQIQYVLESVGQLDPIVLGPVGVANQEYNETLLEGGDVKLFQIEAPLNNKGYWIFLENTVNQPYMVTAVDSMPDPTSNDSDKYGVEGGNASGSVGDPGLIQVSGYVAGLNLTVNARRYQDASYRLRVQEIVPSELPFNGGITNVTSASGTRGAFFYFNVPAGALGWDLRLVGQITGHPRLYIRRGDWMAHPSVAGSTLSTRTDWPLHAQWAANADWTMRWLWASGEDGYGQVFAAGRGRPLEPGLYCVGVFGEENISFGLQSRGIGPGYAIPVPELSFANGTVTTNLPPREAAYFQVNIPANCSSWKVKLSATAGEACLLALKDALPNISVGNTGSMVSTNSAGRKMQKLGDELFVLFPNPGQTTLAAGIYYLAVVSEGIAPASVQHYGSGISTITLTSLGVAPVRQINVPANDDLFVTNSLAAADLEIYQLTIAPGVLNFEAALEDVSGVPVMVMRPGISNAPNPGLAGGAISVDNYGAEGGESVGNLVSAGLITVANPGTTPYTLVIKARNQTNAVYRLRLSASGATPVEFSNGYQEVTGQPGGTWRFFRLRVPTNAVGWDVRLANVTSGLPRLVVRRDSLPTGPATTSSWTPQSTTNWPANYQWAAEKDWTQRTFSSDAAVDETGRILAMGMGRPLEPGIYYVGVSNASPTNVAAYALLSRGIGEGFDVPVVELPFAGSVTNLGLPAREAAYYRVVVPSNAPSWQVKLETLSGESMLVIMRQAVPNVKAITVNGTLAAGKGMQQQGNEHFVLLPGPGLAGLPPGTNYLAVISEGVNPMTTPTNKIGSGVSSYVLRSIGPVPITDLGLLTSEDLVQPDVLDSEEVKAYQFTVPPGMVGCKIKLDGREGNPIVMVLQDWHLPDPGAAVGGAQADSYGNEGGYGITNGHPTLVTLPNPEPGVYTVLVKARPEGTVFKSARYQLRVQELLIPEMNFASAYNTNGITHTAGGILENNERAFFKVWIPETLNDQPVIGWKLSLSGSGDAWVRVRRALLPSDADAAKTMPFTPASAIIAPPYLTNGLWYLEVKGSNSANFTLTSSPLELQRPAWMMPPPGTVNQLPGQPWHVFASTTVSPSGTPLTGDQGVDLSRGEMHYYAVDVPEPNLGLLRAQLDAILGNPNVYLRLQEIPTLYHNTNGAPGTVFDRSMTTATNTEYANWTPLDARKENLLMPGRYYVAVHAAGTIGARYRLMLSAGNLVDLPIDGPMQTNQLLAGGDWRYYRIQVPATVPFSFNLTFSAEQPGSFRVHLRDTVPPGNGISGTDFKDWSTDQKNSSTLLSYVTAGTYTFAVPPVRPGTDYYIGVRAITDSAFRLGVTTNGEAGLVLPVIDFYGGSVSYVLPPFQQVLYRIDVPEEATRWKHFASHSNTVQLYIEQGTQPLRNSTDDWRSGSANSSLNQPLVTWNNTTLSYGPAPWPWIAAQPYYLLVTNTTSLPQDFSFTMDGKNELSEDEDNDGLRDLWERYFFGSLTSQIATNDLDRDNVRNIDEQTDGTDPTNPYSFNCRLVCLFTNGIVEQNPLLDRYPLGSSPVLTARPDDGYSFVGWDGDIHGLSNPLQLRMDTPKIISAIFKLTGDEFITALPLNGAHLTISGINVSMTKEPGEPFHAGNPGGKSLWFRWVAPASGNTTLSTAGSTFNTLLAVYTGSTVSNLTRLASDNNSLGGTNRSQLTFQAVSGITYHIAVDGYNGASSKIMLSLDLQNGAPLQPRFESLAALGVSGVQLELLGEPNRTYVIQASADLADWQPITSIVTDGEGRAVINDTAAGFLNHRFYRAYLP